MTPLHLGADTIQRLIPHRRPFLFVDGIESIDLSSHPTLTGFKHVSANEGMGQTLNVLHVILAIVRGAEAHGHAAEAVLEGLRALDARSRLGKRGPSELEEVLETQLGAPKDRMGVAGALEMKFIEPVFAGATIAYRVTLTHELANAFRYSVSASVRERPVARGTMTSAASTFGA